jgi:hypothetical protein
VIDDLSSKLYILGKLIINKITEIALSKKCQISSKKSKFGNIENIDIEPK